MGNCLSPNSSAKQSPQDMSKIPSEGRESFQHEADTQPTADATQKTPVEAAALATADISGVSPLVVEAGPAAAVEPPADTPPEQQQQQEQQQEGGATGGEVEGPEGPRPGDDFEPTLEGSPPLPQPEDEVVSWADAVEQCSGDEDFLRELLVDLWNETQEHMTELKEKVPKGETVACGRIGHGIKGAAANLMVKRLSAAAFNLEKVGKVDSQEVGGDDRLQALLEAAFRRVTFETDLFEQKLKDLTLI